MSYEEDTGLSEFIIPNGRPPKPAHRVQHGTEKGHFWHRRHGVPICPACRRAHTEYMREWRRKNAKKRKVIKTIMNPPSGGKPITDAEADAIIQELKKDLGL